MRRFVYRCARYGCIVDIGVGEGVGVGVVCACAFAMFAPAAATTAISAKAANKPFMKRIPSSERKRDQGYLSYAPTLASEPSTRGSR